MKSQTKKEEEKEKEMKLNIDAWSIWSKWPYACPGANDKRNPYLASEVYSTAPWPLVAFSRIYMYTQAVFVTHHS